MSNMLLLFILAMVRDCIRSKITGSGNDNNNEKNRVGTMNHITDCVHLFDILFDSLAFLLPDWISSVASRFTPYFARVVID